MNLVILFETFFKIRKKIIKFNIVYTWRSIKQHLFCIDTSQSMHLPIYEVFNLQTHDDSHNWPHRPDRS